MASCRSRTTPEGAFRRSNLGIETKSEALPADGEPLTSVVQGFAWTSIMLLTALAAAALCSTFVDASVPALLLAFAPGGIAEMTIVAFAMGIEVAFVVCCHVFRSIFLVAVVLALYRGLHRD